MTSELRYSFLFLSYYISYRTNGEAGKAKYIYAED